MIDDLFSDDWSGDAVPSSPSISEWLPQRHLARFIVEVVEGLDSALEVRDRALTRNLVIVDGVSAG